MYRCRYMLCICPPCHSSAPIGFFCCGTNTYCCTDAAVTHIYIYIYMYMYMYIYICICIYIYTHTYIHIHVYIYMSLHTRTHTHTHTHTHTQGYKTRMILFNTVFQFGYSPIF
jgi:hypothetical protein